MYRSVSGQIVLEITCADCVGLLNKMQTEQIYARNVIYQGGLKLQITVSVHDYRRLMQLVEKMGGSTQIKRISNAHRIIRKIKIRPVPLLLILFFILITAWLPKRVLFISVDGNTSISTNRILDAAEKFGLHFGASRHSVRSEVIKNALLQEIPQLQWVGVNTNGCTATISVREKTTQDIKENPEKQVCSIVAARDGVIQNCTVYQGNQLCTTGQAVKEGQILVSAYTDCGTMVKATRADAEITALTFRNLEILAPQNNTAHGTIISKRFQYGMRIGKKVINLSKDSGNLDAGCGKIYKEKTICLPGGFTLPISLIRQTIICYADTEQVAITTEDNTWLEEFSKAYLKESMIAGNIVSAQTELIDADGFTCLRGHFACIEMIGQLKYEQMLLKD